MSVDTFSQIEFNEKLPIDKNSGRPLCEHVGFVQGEHCWRMEVKTGVYILIRSSIDKDGFSKACGEDSIRAYLCDWDLKPLGSKVQRWVTRLPGWDKRLTGVLRTLWQRGQQVGHCSHCGALKGVYKVKKNTKNKGRLFTNCPNNHSGQFEWINEH